MDPAKALGIYDENLDCCGEALLYAKASTEHMSSPYSSSPLDSSLMWYERQPSGAYLPSTSITVTCAASPSPPPFVPPSPLPPQPPSEPQFTPPPCPPPSPPGVCDDS
eukprot:1632098-Prymnesium_polylepis.3